MRIRFLKNAAFGALALSMLIGSPANARRVAVDLGPFNFPDFGTQWDDPVKADVRNDSCFGGGACSAEALPFAINYGSGLKNSLFIYENGFVTLGAAVDPARLSYADLNAFGTDVIAPAFGDFISSEPSFDRGYFDGEVSHTTGDADFTGPPYDTSEIAFNSIFNVTWNYLAANADGPNAFNTYQFQIQFLDATAFDASAVAGDFDLSLNFGTPLPAGAFTGFKLGDYTVSVDQADIRPSGDYVYAFRGGRLLGATPSGVPEPQSWAMMLFGAGMVGAAARRKRSSQSVSLAR